MTISKSASVDNNIPGEHAPRFVKSKNFKIVLEWLCQSSNQKYYRTINALAKKVGVSQEVVYRYMRHEYTKKLIMRHINGLSAMDQIQLYHSVYFDKLKRAHFRG